MKNGFKVLDWLREVRDRQAAETAQMDIQERLAYGRKQAQPIVRDFLKAHSEPKSDLHDK